MKKIVIIPNPTKDPGLTVTGKLVEVLLGVGLDVYLEKTLNTDFGGVYEYDVFPSDADLIVVVGGDGSVIDASRSAISYGIPLVGVNMGTVGYLSEVDPDKISIFERLVSGDYRIEEKMLLSALVPGGSECSYAVNDVIVSHGEYLGISNFRLEDSCGNSLNYRADGVIVATPQGSTAYSFSSGGPVLAHDAEGILVTPICPHSFFNRSVLFNAREQITVTNTGEHPMNVAVDGRKLCELSPGQYCSVRRADRSLSMLSFSSNSMFKELFKKMSVMEDLKL